MKLKRRLCLLLWLCCSGLQAANPLHCLGDEEESLHKAKAITAEYKLNQSFINLFSQSNALRLRPKKIREICSRQNFAPSKKLLRMLILAQQDVFQRKNQQTEELMFEVYPLFLKYMADLNSQFPWVPNCLDKKITSLRILNGNYQYLGLELSMEKIFNLKTLTEIYQALPLALKACKEANASASL